VASCEQLQGQLVSFAFCPLSKRQFAVLRGSLHQQQQQQQQGTGAAAAEEQQHHAHPQGQSGAGQSAFKVWLVVQLHAGMHRLAVNRLVNTAHCSAANSSRQSSFFPRYLPSLIMPAFCALQRPDSSAALQPTHMYVSPTLLHIVNFSAAAATAAFLLQLDALEAKLCQLLGRSLHVDSDTAKFYLGEAGGDIKAAMEAFGERCYVMLCCVL
jgi:stress-induced morphogen